MAQSMTVSKTEEGTRLLRWFLRHYPGMPQREFYKLCRGGQIRVNSSRVRGNEVLRAGDTVRIPPTIATYQSAAPKAESGDRFSLADLEELRKCIIHDDDDIVVLNKPAGLAVQGGTGIRKSVDKMVAAMYPYDKISLVHRLDRETSGVLVVAKNQMAAQNLARAFQDKTAHKEYLALLAGRVNPTRGTIDNYLIKGAVVDGPARINGGQRPQRAITDYNVLGAAGDLTWMSFSPKTGRTHQLRIHSAQSLHAPIVGDALYGAPVRLDPALSSLLTTKNLFLFAHKITFQHPTTGRMLTLRATVPEFMVPILKFLEFQIP
ncbi:MAG: RluA family pseudouridine synthase [Alphaproteobacteria bacterium]|nr:RluA family pseudouridine synthase [Alphaproteobacteria bacterium]